MSSGRVEGESAGCGRLPPPLTRDVGRTRTVLTILGGPLLRPETVDRRLPSSTLAPMCRAKDHHVSSSPSAHDW